MGSLAAGNISERQTREEACFGKNSGAIKILKRTSATRAYTALWTMTSTRTILQEVHVPSETTQPVVDEPGEGLPTINRSAIVLLQY